MNNKVERIIEYSDGTLKKIVIRTFKYSRIYKCPFILYFEDGIAKIAKLVENSFGDLEFNPICSSKEEKLLKAEIINPYVKRLNIKKLPKVIYCNNYRIDKLKPTVIIAYKCNEKYYYDKFGKQVMSDTYFNYINTSSSYIVFEENIDITKNVEIISITLYLDKHGNHYLDKRGKFLISKDKYILFNNKKIYDLTEVMI